MNIFTQGLETERMYLVPLHEKYTEDMFQGLDEEVTKYMTVSPYNDISLLPELETRVTKTLQEIKEHKKIVLAGIHKESSEFLGVFSIS